ncbi:2-dehydro-3-deoxygluconokinase [Catellatospora sp. TT07R-123]|uniref:carbohydrate kinase family protein n=1 Tax=Catellatospora sp. TT07R-123 TaxID=2733863 RepID=UPI001B1F4E87|nr:carbohydrate kinase family protein [Catellatospora sp. TT07R-123]GHJ48259.1 2-dehydro-3-deoxygluconokinase [Catellatospora sp. TT07R-123]
MRDLDVLVLGGVGIDTIVRVPTLSVPPGDFLPVAPIHDYVAHSGNGVALGFHALGLRTLLADFLGDDPMGELVLRRYAAVGLDFTHLPAPGGTPRAVNLVDAQGRRFSFFDGRHPHGLALPPEFYLPLLERTRHVHIAATHAVGAFAEARRLGVTASADIHAWDGENPWALPFLRDADLVFFSAQAAPDRVDEIMRRVLELGRARVVVATEGAAGSRVLTREQPQVRRFPVAAPQRPVVDSNGAGDAFSTAFMSRWLAGDPVEECMRAGAVSGAYACGAAGTHEDLITAAALDTAIAGTRAGAAA